MQSSAHALLEAIAIVLGVAAVTTVVFQRLKQPVVLGYILAGLVIGPHLPIPLVADPQIVQTLSELGVILLMFSLGLEFRLRRLIQLGPTAGITAVIETSLMIWLGFIAARLLGWTRLESLFTGAIVAISSTTIITKAFSEQKVNGRLRDRVVGILIVEDLIAILLMAVLTAVATGSALTTGSVALMIGKLAAFLVALVVIGLLVVPRAVRYVHALGRAETTLVASVGLCFVTALIAQSVGYSVALGAFLAGTLVAESGHAKDIEHLVHPVRDVFAAIFFVSVGMLIDPALIARHWAAVVTLTVLVVAGKLLSVTVGAFLTGNGTRTSLQAGMSLAQIGEFSFILAALGQALGATRSFLYPVAVAVSAVTALLTPTLVRASGPFASLVDRKLPHRVQTFAALYARWVEELGGGRHRDRRAHALRRLILLLAVDALLVGAIVIAAALALPSALALATERFGVSERVGRLVVVALALGIAAPFCAGIVRVAQRLGVSLASTVFPARARVDLAAAPRRALIVAFQLVTVLVVGIPLLALTQPFVAGPAGAIVLLVALAVLGVAFWRSTANLEGHVRAGAEAVVELLARQAQDDDALEGRGASKELLPGLGAPVPLHLPATSAAVGQTLAQLNLRGLTGATVLAIRRGETGISFPAAEERLQAEDVLALAGSHEAVAAAKKLLLAGAPPLKAVS